MPKKQNHITKKKTPPSDMSGQDTTMAPNPSPYLKLPVISRPTKLPWDARADEYAKNANQTGKTLPRIAKELCKKGYAASTVEVYESLSKQNVNISMEWTTTLGTTTTTTTTDTPTTVVPPTTTVPLPAPTVFLEWDSRADEMTLAAHQLGHSSLQLFAELRSAGYQALVEEVGASIYRQGIDRL